MEHEKDISEEFAIFFRQYSKTISLRNKWWTQETFENIRADIQYKDYILQIFAVYLING